MSRDEQWRRYANQLESFALKEVNYDTSSTHEYSEVDGWNIDEYWEELPSEPPGSPQPNGSWETAKEVLYNYEFPDPQILTGIYLPGSPLEGRVMLLRARFLWLRFTFGVRISRVINELRVEEGEPVQAWGYSYRTLEGHWEMGEITFEILKYLNNGRVRFHIYSYSKPGHIPNIFYRIGFRIFGRSLQQKFALTALKRTHRFVEERMVPPKQRRFEHAATTAKVAG